MITEFRIENFKSIEKLNIKLGRVNVLIGENGSGKSNILEAIALASAVTQNKLDNEFLSSRGIRVTIPQLMRSAFSNVKVSESINLGFTNSSKYKIDLLLSNSNEAYSKWTWKINRPTEQIDEFDPFREEYEKISGLEFSEDLVVTRQLLANYFKRLEEQYFKDFLIYSPENTSLRTFEKEGQIEPLGIYGEGLFKLLKFFASRPDQSNLNEIKQYLKLFDWFKDFTIPDKLFEGESMLQIKDRYLDANIDYFDQRSSNEGFLFVLFYYSLMISDLTPGFFAIDNIESSLNPKLCTKLIKSIAELSKKHDKQIIVTTHSPSVLDGLDLNNPEHKLFVVYRNKLGHTSLKQIEKPKPLEGQEPIKLSEAFLRGYIGGLPKNFSL